ncbi:hypothetical protein BBJ28_00017965 [Nothophytophthora sp. Chile5]|nr:hypothetical protein BBJ28_00017965 [Nothophytophthora sp. Chile5]
MKPRVRALLSWPTDRQRRSRAATRIAVGAAKDLDDISANDLPLSPSTDTATATSIYGRLLETPEATALCKRLGLTRGDVRDLRRKFDDEDGTHSDSVTLRGLFHLLNNNFQLEKSHVLTQALLDLAAVPPLASRVSFDQYLLIACTFAAFTEPQLWRFFYDVYSTGDGEMELQSARAGRFEATLKAVGGSYAHNIQVATRRLAASQLEGKATSLRFVDFEELVRRHPVAFYPLVQLQRNVRGCTLGESFWEGKVQEQELLPPLLAYLRLHRGKLPRMRLKDWAMGRVFSGNTSVVRARLLALRLFNEDEDVAG